MFFRKIRKRLKELEEWRVQKNSADYSVTQKINELKHDIAVLKAQLPPVYLETTYDCGYSDEGEADLIAKGYKCGGINGKTKIWVKPVNNKQGE